MSAVVGPKKLKGITCQSCHSKDMFWGLLLVDYCRSLPPLLRSAKADGLPHAEGNRQQPGQIGRAAATLHAAGLV